MMKLKKLFSLLLCLMMAVSFLPFAHAHGEGASESVPGTETPNGIPCDVKWPEERGNNPPTSSNTTSLPYTASATIRRYVYTSKCFPPNSSGEIHTAFYGSIVDVNGNDYNMPAKVTITLYSLNGSDIESHTYASATSWTNKELTWSGLNTGTCYYFKIEKNTQLGYLSFSMSCTK